MSPASQNRAPRTPRSAIMIRCGARSPSSPTPRARRRPSNPSRTPRPRRPPRRPGCEVADAGEGRPAQADMQWAGPQAAYLEEREGAAALAQRIVDPRLWRADRPLRVVLIGTDFEVRVWETLLKIPMGRAVC